MPKYKAADGVEVKAVHRKADKTHGNDFWQITFPDDTIKEIIDTSPLTGRSAFAVEFKEVK